MTPPPLSPDAYLAQSQSAQNAGDFIGMVEAAQQAHRLEPGKPDAALRLAECYFLGGQVRLAIELLHRLEKQSPDDPFLLQRVAGMYTKCSHFTDAHRCYEQAAKLSPRDSRCLYNLAASCIALGQIAEAERLLTEVIRLDPRDYDAWQNRSTLRRQTPADNHVTQLQFVLSHLDASDPGRMPVCYALAKELEDLELYAESFACLQQGAVARRERMDYDVGRDIEAMELIEQTFTAEVLSSHPPGEPSTRPVFVLGLPRSGTTLVDRIISSHSEASSLGEINTLAFALMRAAAESQSTSSGAPGAAQSRTDLIRQSANIDFARLGALYASAIDQYGFEGQRLVDKTPLNFLYIGLIHLALPGARVIHLRRHPLDSCYAIYKTLFRMGYPFSYSLQDVGRYYIAYHRLMAH